MGTAVGEFCDKPRLSVKGFGDDVGVGVGEKAGVGVGVGVKAEPEPGIVTLVPANIVLPLLYLGFVVSTGLALRIAETVVPFALAIELSV
jgi:hypothetical protein